MAEPDVRPFLGIVASKSFRRVTAEHQARAQRGEVIDTIDDFIEQYRAVLAKYRLLVTRGTYIDAFAPPSERAQLLGVKGSDAIEWQSRFPELDGEVLRRGKDGGLVELSARLPEPPPWKTGPDTPARCKVILFFMDPEDYEEQFPENRQLIRLSSVANATLLINYYSASLWANNESDFALHDPTKPPPCGPKDVIALIAHNDKKIPMCKFVAKHRDRLTTFESIIATGTTGAEVLGFLHLFDDTFARVDRQNSGPKGGDAEISKLILDGACQHVCFFIDPMTAHPHEADVFSLLRACTFYGCNVNLRLSPNAANSWIETIP